MMTEQSQGHTRAADPGHGWSLSSAGLPTYIAYAYHRFSARTKLLGACNEEMTSECVLLCTKEKTISLRLILGKNKILQILFLAQIYV